MSPENPKSPSGKSGKRTRWRRSFWCGSAMAMALVAGGILHHWSRNQLRTVDFEALDYPELIERLKTQPTLSESDQRDVKKYDDLMEQVKGGQVFEESDFEPIEEKHRIVWIRVSNHGTRTVSEFGGIVEVYRPGHSKPVGRKPFEADSILAPGEGVTVSVTIDIDGVLMSSEKPEYRIFGGPGGLPWVTWKTTGLDDWLLNSLSGR